MQRGAADLGAAEGPFLLGERYLLPLLNVEPDDAHDLVGATRRPGGLRGVRLHPYILVLLRGARVVRVGEASFETEEFPRDAHRARRAGQAVDAPSRRH